jgi:hypothetical protein
MRAHTGMHILRSLTNTPEEIALTDKVCVLRKILCRLMLIHMYQVGAVLPCGFCGRSGLSECMITIKVPSSGAPVWETKCMYQHPFRYGFAEAGSKNKPCRNVPLKCELCHPQLPPEPGRSSRRALAVAVDAVWRYNMTEHIATVHEEYLGAPLPASIMETMNIKDLEYIAARIPKEHWPASHISSTEHNKENVPASGSRIPKRSALNSAGSLPSKRARISVPALQVSRTLVV